MSTRALPIAILSLALALASLIVDLKSGSMSTRIAARYISRRLSSGGKILGEEEKAAENVYIKRVEREKLEKLAQKGPNPEAKPATGSGDSSVPTDAKPRASTSSTSRVSTDKHRNYAVVAGVVTVFAALGWYLKGSKKTEDVNTDAN